MYIPAHSLPGKRSIDYFYTFFVDYIASNNNHCGNGLKLIESIDVEYQ